MATPQGTREQRGEVHAGIMTGFRIHLRILIAHACAIDYTLGQGRAASLGETRNAHYP